ncbi:MAG: hypothetical protein P8Y98_13535 [Anaerolineales bacterium]
MPIFDHFDILAPLYDRLIRIPENDRLAQVVGLPVAGRLLGRRTGCDVPSVLIPRNLPLRMRASNG